MAPIPVKKYGSLFAQEMHTGTDASQVLGSHLQEIKTVRSTNRTACGDVPPKENSEKSKERNMDLA